MGSRAVFDCVDQERGHVGVIIITSVITLDMVQNYAWPRTRPNLTIQCNPS